LIKLFELNTDDTMRSTMEYGSRDFPFACYLDELETLSSRCIEWHWHREVEFSLVLQGTVLCRAGNQVYSLKCGDGLFINSEVIHRFESEHDGIMVNLIFAPEFIAEETSLIYSRYVEPLVTGGESIIPFFGDGEENAEVLTGIRRLWSSTRDSSYASELKIRNAATQLWTAFVDFTKERPNNTISKGDKILRARMQKMLTYIRTNYAFHVSLGDIAAAASISESEALRCFRASMRTTPIVYLNDYRLSRAKELLLSTADTVSAIALSVGFDNPSYFCRVFRKRYGVTPNALRKTHSGL